MITADSRRSCKFTWCPTLISLPHCHGLMIQCGGVVLHWQQPSNSAVTGVPDIFLGQQDVGALPPPLASATIRRPRRIFQITSRGLLFLTLLAVCNAASFDRCARGSDCFLNCGVYSESLQCCQDPPSAHSLDLRWSLLEECKRIKMSLDFNADTPLGSSVAAGGVAQDDFGGLCVDRCPFGSEPVSSQCVRSETQVEVTTGHSTAVVDCADACEWLQGASRQLALFEFRLRVAQLLRVPIHEVQMALVWEVPGRTSGVGVPVGEVWVIRKKERRALAAIAPRRRVEATPTGRAYLAIRVDSRRFSSTDCRVLALHNSEVLSAVLKLPVVKTVSTMVEINPRLFGSPVYRLETLYDGKPKELGLAFTSFSAPPPCFGCTPVEDSMTLSCDPEDFASQAPVEIFGCESGGGASSRRRRSTEGSEDDVEVDMWVVKGHAFIEGEMDFGLVAQTSAAMSRSIAKVGSIPEASVEMTPKGSCCSSSGGIMLDMAYMAIPNRYGGVHAEALQAALNDHRAIRREFFVDLQSDEETIELADLGLIGKWTVSMGESSITKALVTRPMGAIIGGDAPSTGGGSSTPAPITTEPPDTCQSAVTPCACADSMSGSQRCAWSGTRTGGSCAVAAPCVGSACLEPPVPCEYCATQPHWGPNYDRCRNAFCAKEKDPCRCMEIDGCNWDGEAGECSYRSTRNPACSICPRQTHCRPPKLVEINPFDKARMSRHVLQEVKLFFDRKVRMAYQNGAPLSSNFWCEGSGQATQVAGSRLSMEDFALIIDASELFLNHREEKMRCDLEIPEGTVVSDADDTPFLGMVRGTYHLVLLDGTAPRLRHFQPENGDEDVPVSTTVELTFDEPVFLAGGSTELRISIDALDPPASNDVASPVVTTEGTTLLIKTGQMEPGTLYTLSVPAGAIVDAQSNPFPGLSSQTYTFRTVPGTVRIDRAVDANGSRGMIMPAVLGALAVVCCLCGATVVHTQMQKSQNSLSAVRPNNDNVDLEGKQREVGYRGELREDSKRHSDPAAEIRSPTVTRPSAPAMTRSPTLPIHIAPPARRTAPPSFRAAATAATAASRARRSSLGADDGKHFPRRNSKGSTGSPETEGHRESNSSSGSAAPPESQGPRTAGARQECPPGPPPSASKGAPPQGGDSTPRRPAHPEDAAAREETKKVEAQLQSLKNEPMQVRRTALRTLMAEYHPDKNSAEHAKAVFQFINASRSWFLHERAPPNTDGA